MPARGDDLLERWDLTFEWRDEVEDDLGCTPDATRSVPMRASLTGTFSLSWVLYDCPDQAVSYCRYRLEPEEWAWIHEQSIPVSVTLSSSVGECLEDWGEGSFHQLFQVLDRPIPLVADVELHRSRAEAIDVKRIWVRGGFLSGATIARRYGCDTDSGCGETTEEYRGGLAIPHWEALGDAFFELPVEASGAARSRA